MQPSFPTHKSTRTVLINVFIGLVIGLGLIYGVVTIERAYPQKDPAVEVASIFHGRMITIHSMPGSEIYEFKQVKENVDGKEMEVSTIHMRDMKTLAIVEFKYYTTSSEHIEVRN